MQTKFNIKAKKVTYKNHIRRNLILRALLNDGQLSMTELSKKTGVTIPIVAQIVASLKKDEYLVDVQDTVTTQAGRPPNIVKLNGNAGYILGIDLGRVDTNFVLINLEQKIIGRIRQKKSYLDNDVTILEELKKELMLFISSTKVNWDSILGIGFSIPGIVNGPLGTTETYLKFKNGKSIRKTLREYFEKPVHIEHDVKAMALGELWFGKAKNVKNALCLKVDWGVGLGLIMDGKIYYGNHSYAGEFGHIQVVQDGKLCHCGKIGCLETVASGRALNELMKEKLTNGSESLLVKEANGNLDNLEWNMLIDCANRGDRLSIELLDNFARILGTAIGTLINLFDPEKIIIGGGLSHASSHVFLDIVRSKGINYSLNQLNRNVEFLNSDLDPIVGALGVSMLAARDIFEVEHLNPTAYI